MENVSVFLKRIMLGILLAVLLITLGLILREGLTARSYLAALVLGALWCVGLFWLLRRGALDPPPHAALRAMLLCLVLNGLWVLVVRIEPFSDYAEYWDVARALADGLAIPDAWYVAMYPHILGTATVLSLPIRLFGAKLSVVTALNTLLTTLSCGLVWLLGRELLSRRAAYVAALLWAVAPCKLMLGSLVFSEPIYTFLILLFFWLFLRLEKRMRRGSLWAALGMAALGLLLAAIQIVRPIASILLIAVALWLLLLRGREAKNARRWLLWLVSFMAMLGLFRASLTLWNGHVERVLDQEIATVPWYNIYVGLNGETGGRYTDADMDLLTAYLKQGLTADEAQRHMIPHIKERLSSGLDYKKLLAEKLFAFLGADQLGGYTYRFTRPERFVKVCMVLCNVFYYGVYLAALAGILRMLRRRTLSPGLLLPLFFLGLTLAHMLVEVADRYHYSLIPLLIIFAVLGLTGEERRTL